MLTPQREDGFTLIELLVTIAIVGVVTLALGNALIGVTKNTDTTIRRLGESHDAQISAAYFAQDVASIGLRSGTSPYPLLQSVETNAASANLACGTGGTSVVRFGWDDPTSPTGATQVRVDYRVQTVSDERQLHRVACAGSSVTSDTIVAHSLDTATPTVTCSTTCTAAAPPQSVTMVLFIKDPLNPGPVYSVTLTGQRRQT